MQNTDITITFIQTIATLYAFFFAVYTLGIKKHTNDSPYHSYFYAISFTVIIALFFYALILFIHSQNTNFLLFYANTPVFNSLLEFVKSYNLNYFNAIYTVFIFTIGYMFIYAKILLDFYKKVENQKPKIKKNRFMKYKLKVAPKVTFNLLKDFFSKMGIYGNLILIIMLIFFLLQFPEISLSKLIIFISMFYLAMLLLTFVLVITIFCLSWLYNILYHFMKEIKKPFMKN